MSDIDSLEELFKDSFGELDESLLDSAEILEQNQSYNFTQDKVEDILYDLKEIRDDLIQVHCLNSAIAKCLEEKTLDYKKNNKYNKTNNDDVLATSSEIEKIQRHISELEEQIYMDTELGVSKLNGGITFRKASSFQDSIPKKCGMSTYREKILQLQESGKYPSYDSPLFLEDKNDLYKILKDILFYVTSSNNADYNKTKYNLITDSSDDYSLESNDTISKSEAINRFRIRSLETLDRVNKLNELINILEKGISESLNYDALPDIYVVNNIMEINKDYSNTVYNRIEGEVFLSNKTETERLKTIIRPATFPYQIHLLGLSNVIINNEALTLKQNFKDMYIQYLSDNKLEEVEKVSGIPKITGNIGSNVPIIEVPMCIFGTDSNGRDYLYISRGYGKYSLKDFEEMELGGDGDNSISYLDFLINLSSGRSSAIDTPTWYSKITLTSNTSKELVKPYEKRNNNLILKRYTNDELFDIAKTKSARHSISTSYLEMSKNKNISETLRKVASVKYKLDKNLTELVMLSLNIPPHMRAVELISDGTLTPNRNILISTLLPVTSGVTSNKLELEEIYNKNLNQVYTATMNQILGKLEYDLDKIMDLLGSDLVKSDFFDNCYNSLDDKNANTKYKVDTVLQMSDIQDIVWFMLRIHAMGFPVQDFNKDVIKLNLGWYHANVNNDTDLINRTIEEYSDAEKADNINKSFSIKGNLYLSSDEFVELIVNELQKPKEMSYLWGYSVKSSESVDRNSLTNKFLLLILTEAYAVIKNIISLNDTNKDVFDSYSVNTNNKEEENELVVDYINNIKTEDNMYNTYECVKNLGIDEINYAKYSRYLENYIINPLLRQSALTFKEPFDGRYIVNSYIKSLNTIKKENTSLVYQLIDTTKDSTTKDQIAENLLSNYKENDEERYRILQELSDIDIKISTTSQLLLEEFTRITNVELNLNDEDKQRFETLLQNAVYSITFSDFYIIMLAETVMNMTNEGKLEQFSADDYSRFLQRVGLDLPENYEIRFNIPEDYIHEYNVVNFKNSIKEDINLYPSRDVKVMSKVLGNYIKKLLLDINKVINSGDNEQLSKAVENLDKQVLKKVSTYDKASCDKRLSNIKEKLNEYVNTDVMSTHINNTLDFLCPSYIDKSILLENLSLAISNTISNDTFQIDITMLDMDKISKEEVQKLEDEVKHYMKVNDLITNISQFIPTSVIIDSNISLSQANKKVKDIFEECSIKQDIRIYDRKHVSKSIALYTRYLKTPGIEGEKYLKEVDMNLIPFDLLTTGAIAIYKRVGTYSIEQLDFDYNLSQISTLLTKVELYESTPYEEIIEMVEIVSPGFKDTLPLPIKDYVAKRERLNQINRERLDAINLEISRKIASRLEEDKQVQA